MNTPATAHTSAVATAAALSFSAMIAAVDMGRVRTNAGKSSDLAHMSNLPNTIACTPTTNTGTAKKMQIGTSPGGTQSGRKTFGRWWRPATNVMNRITSTRAVMAGGYQTLRARSNHSCDDAPDENFRGRAETEFDFESLYRTRLDVPPSPRRARDTPIKATGYASPPTTALSTAA